MPINGIFGFSRPFIKSTQLKKGLAPHAPLFEKTVLRIRDGFQKIPIRGTFSRASKGLTAEWYPMDCQDLEAIRRRGYFHETIGDIQKYSYRDLKTQLQTGMNRSIEATNAETLDRSGSQVLAASFNHRRGSIGQHMSRYFLLLVVVVVSICIILVILYSYNLLIIMNIDNMYPQNND